MTSLTYTLLQFPNLRGRFYFMISFFVILTCDLVILQLHSKTGSKSDISGRKKIVKSKNVSNFALKFINRPKISTYLDLEKKHSLCEIKFVESAPPEHPDCPKSGIVTVRQGGRLGNQIWEYMAVWLVAKKTGLKQYVPKCIKQYLSKLFDNLNIPKYDEIRSCSLVEKNIEKIEATGGSSPWIYNQSIILPNSIVKAELLDNINDISKVFTIRQKLLDESQKILYSGLSFLNKSADSIFIGVHIRRTDYLYYIKQKFQLVPDVLKFIRAAMAYYEHKFHNPIFILVSDDPKWCWNNFHTKNNVFVPGKLHKSPPELDIALMASCNHSIIDYGTFGQWGALLAGGETIFYPIHMKYSSDKLGKNLKNWQGSSTPSTSSFYLIFSEASYVVSYNEGYCHLQNCVVDSSWINPQHTVPLLDDDGFILPDSHAIMTYLVSKYAKGSALYPQDLKQRAIIDHKLHFDSSTLFIRGGAIVRAIVFEGETDVDSKKLAALEDAYVTTEKFLEKTPYIAGNEITVADFSFVTSLSTFQAFLPISEAKYPKITAWIKKLEKLPYYKEANQAGLDEFLSLIKTKLAK